MVSQTEIIKLEGLPGLIGSGAVMQEVALLVRLGRELAGVSAARGLPAYYRNQFEPNL
jgi:hypothetical protein